MNRIADFHLQSTRLFGRLLTITDTPYTTIFGKYDYIFTHRQIENEGEIEKIISYCKPTSTIIVDITTESGQVEVFLNVFKQIIKNYNYKFVLIADVPIKENLNCKVIDDYSLAFASHLNDNLFGRVYFHTTGASLKHGLNSFNGSLRNQRVWLNWLLVRKFKNSELPLSVEFHHYINGENGPAFVEKEWNEFLKKFPKEVEENLRDRQFITKHTEKNPILLNEYNKVSSLTETINLVSENVVGSDMNVGDDKHHITFTEKTIKPFIRGQIPLIHGYFGLQNELRKLGFDLFDDLIDNSYEQESDSYKRLQMLVDESYRLLNIDTETYLKNNIKRVYNNKKLCEKLVYKGKTLIYNLVEEIIL